MIEYVRSSIFRQPEFRVSTIIETVDGVKRIRKTAETPAAQSHLESLPKKYKQLVGTTPGFTLIEPRLEDNDIIIDFVEGALFEDIVTRYFLDSKYDEILEGIGGILRQIDQLPTTERSEQDKTSFSKVFGDALEDEKVGITCGYIDFNLDNIIEKNGQLNLIDYEWVFDYPIPINYVKSRIVLNTLLHMHSLVNASASEQLPVHETNLGILVPKFIYDAFKELIDLLPLTLRLETAFQATVQLISPTEKPEFEQLKIVKTLTEPIDITVQKYLRDVIDNQDSDLEGLKERLATSEASAAALQAEIAAIKNSKGWRALETARKLRP